MSDGHSRVTQYSHLSRYHRAVRKLTYPELEKRIRFLLPTPIAIYAMVGMAFLGSDSLAVKEEWALAWIIPCELLLIWNIVLRRRLKKQLRLRTAGFCENCGYDIRATPTRCPECGALCIKH
jgi:hypothetical protein